LSQLLVADAEWGA